MSPIKSVWRLACCAAVLTVAAMSATAQTYPDKPVRLVIGYAPGGLNDILGRLIAKELTTLWKQTVVVDNRPGANGLLAAQAVAKAAPDGYTLLLATPGPLTQNAALQALPIDVIKDFTPIVQVVDAPVALVVDPKLPVNTMQEFVQYARQAQPTLSYSSPGIGNGSHFFMEMVKQQAGLSMMHIPYKGAVPALNDVMGGQVQACITSVAAIMPFANSGRLKVLAISTPARIAELPNVPTMREVGYPSLEVSIYGGLLGPASLPKPVVQKIYADAMKAMKSPEFLATLRQNGLVPATATPEQFADIMIADLARWKKVAHEASMKPE